ncbi:hypothetical protein ACHAWF_015250 [Thalassiosira exigua]
MTSLQEPLTIISHGSGASDHGGHTSSPQYQPLPPAATWFDEDPLHFVALEARPAPSRRPSITGHHHSSDSTVDGGFSTIRGSFVSGVGSIDSSTLVSETTRRGTSSRRGSDGSLADDDYGRDATTATSEFVRYQAFALPKRGQRHDGGNETGSVYSSTSKWQPISAFDAAKRAAQANLRALPVEISVSFPLPKSLAIVDEYSSRNDPSVMSSGSGGGRGEDDDTYTCGTDPTVLISRRIPILAKFSPKMSCGTRFLAMQFSPVSLRIATVEGNVGADGSVEDTSKAGASVGRRDSFGEDGAHCHWTIDLSRGSHPVSSSPGQLPYYRRASTSNLFGKPNRAEEGIVIGSTSIVGGGVLWCTRKEDSLDLIVVTTTSVLVYNVNTARKGQLVRSRAIPHDAAASFWYEPLTRTLVIGSYRRHDDPSQKSLSAGINDYAQDRLASSGSSSHPEESYREGSYREGASPPRATTEVMFPSATMEMKALFFSNDSSSVDAFPTFSVGALREVPPPSGMGEGGNRHELMLSLETFDSPGPAQEEDRDSAVVLPTEIFLVNLYGSAYCVEIGSLGSGKGIGLTRLDSQSGCIYVRQQNFDALKGQKVDMESISVGVIDDLLCIFSKKDETTHFLDVADLFSEDQRVHRGSIDHFEPDIHDGSLSFLAPSYFLDTSGQGLLYEVVLDLSLYCQSAPATGCIIPSLLRRDAPRAEIRLQIARQFGALIRTQGMPSLRSWIGVIVEQYAKSESGLKYDSESTVALLSKSSLVTLDGIGDPDDDAAFDHVMVPLSCKEVLTQTEILETILLPHAASAIKKDDLKKLKFISSLSVHYFVELERKLMTPCVALQCLVVALLWRIGESAELSSYLSARQSQWTITRRRKQMNLPTANRMNFDSPGAISFAEIMFRIVSEEALDKASVPCSPSTKRQLISYATIILIGCGATYHAAKCLLSVGHLNEAISVCKKKLKSNKAENIIPEGMQSKDFFRAAISNAKKMPTVSDRCQSFFHLHCFLKQWNPSAFKLDSRKVRVLRRGSSSKLEQKLKSSFLSSSEEQDSVVVEQSVLAHECPRFPDELFGGKESRSCQKLRAMFGYVQNIK